VGFIIGLLTIKTCQVQIKPFVRRGEEGVNDIQNANVQGEGDYSLRSAYQS
jgi:hypothetical protein